MINPEGVSRKVIVGFALVLLLAAFATGWRLNALKQKVEHPDDIIAAAVVQRILSERTLDTNWARTHVAEQFRYDQYNFSGYYLFAAAYEALSSMVTGPAEDIAQRLRGLNALLGGLLVLLSGLLAFWLAGPIAGGSAALLTGTCVTLVQDSIYARPEAFASVLALFILVPFARAGAPRTRHLLPILGLLLGLLVSIKVTFLLLTPFPLLASAMTGPARRPALSHGAVYLITICLGFAIGAPYAVVHPSEYVSGVAYLVDQYGKGHGPHGLIDGSLLDRLRHSSAYLHHAIGSSVFLLAGIGGARLFAARRFSVLVAMLGIFLSAAYFLQSRAFFERNLSHALPVLFVLAGVGIQEVGRLLARGQPIIAAIAAISLAVAVAWPSAMLAKQVTSVWPRLRLAERSDAVEARLNRDGYLVFDAGLGASRLSEFVGHRCGKLAFRLTDFGDRHTAARIDALVGSGRFRLLERIEGPFHKAPVSTLQTYHAADVVFLGLIDPPTWPCMIRFEPVRWPATAKGVEVSVHLEGSAAEGGLPPGVAGPDWRRPVYSTWGGKDENTGVIRLGPFNACRDVAFPVTGGTHAQAVRLTIAERTIQSLNVVDDGPVPTARNGWTLVRIRVGTGDCRSLRIEASDTGVKWGQWVGVGMPVAVEHGP